MRKQASVALDCASYNSALETSSSILQMESADLLRRLQEFEYNDVPEPARHRYPYGQLLIRYALRVDQNDLPAPASVYWFHATRVSPQTNFSEGILPFTELLDQIWQMLGGLASDWSTPEQWAAFRSGMKGDGALQYGTKFEDPGPHASLVRDAIFKSAEMGNHNYLEIPEIVEDICFSYDEEFGRQLRRRYQDATLPCIVKFSSVVPRADALAAALNYVHAVSRGFELSRCCDTGFSGEGHKIDPDAIERIEWFE